MGGFCGKKHLGFCSCRFLKKGLLDLCKVLELFLFSSSLSNDGYDPFRVWQIFALLIVIPGCQKIFSQRPLAFAQCKLAKFSIRHPQHHWKKPDKWPPKIVLIFDQFWVIFQRCGLDENIDGDKKRLKNHKEGRIFLLAKFGVFLGSADLLDTLFLRLSFLHFGIPKAIWKIFEMAVD